MVAFFRFHLMPWPDLPEDFDSGHESAWITLPNRYYSPERGHVPYNETSMNWSVPRPSGSTVFASANITRARRDHAVTEHHGSRGSPENQSREDCDPWKRPAAS